jgi:FixJ family two-component response regulator
MISLHSPVSHLLPTYNCALQKILLSFNRRMDADLPKIPMISIVDDDEAVREATKSLIKSLGYAAATFASAEEFLKSNLVDGCSCLITDVQMPGMSGIELQRRLITEGNCLPIIFITAYPEAKVRTRAMQAGALGFLRKPFNEKDMITCLAKALKDHQS